MTENNIIALTPFRADLTRALTRRGERLLASTDLAGEVAALDPLEAYYIVREIGLDQSLPILLQLSPEQLETSIDLDCWNRYDFDAENLDEWLKAFSLAGPEELAKAYFSLNYAVQLLFLTQTVTVYDPDTDHVPPEEDEEETIRAMTPDGFYLLELKNEFELSIHPFTLLDAMYQFDSSATHQLLSQIRVDLESQIEEEALRFRNGRLEDIGFVAPDEAAVLFSKPARQPLPRPHKPIDEALTRVPSLYAVPFIETTLLQQALSRITDQEFLSRLEQEIVWAINSAIIAYGEKTKDTAQITDIAERVRDTISLGLEWLVMEQEAGLAPDIAVVAARAAELLDIWCIIDLFRHGVAATLSLQKEARLALRDPGFDEWYHLSETSQSEEEDESGGQLDRAFVAALLGRHPLRGGVDPARPERVKAFASLDEKKDAESRLQQIIALHRSQP